MVRHLLFLALTVLIGCGGETLESLTAADYGQEFSDDQAVRLILNQESFNSIRDFPTGSRETLPCLGDARIYYSAIGPGYDASYEPLRSYVDAGSLARTVRPIWLKNASLDMTFTHYDDAEAGQLESDACSDRGYGSRKPSACAEFDRADGVITNLPSLLPVSSPTPAPSPTPAAYPAFSASNTGFYRTKDGYCEGQGPIESTGIPTTKTYVGGIDIDLDRSRIASSENFYFALTYHSMGPEYGAPGAVTPWPDSDLSPEDESLIRVRLISTGLGHSFLTQILQPRSFFNFNASNSTVVFEDLHTFQDEFRGIRTEGFVVPLSVFPSVDRIRIERIRGTAYLYQLDLYRLGPRE
jgi:hypothetical protein